MDRPVHPAAAQKGAIGRVDDGVHSEPGDVGLDDFYSFHGAGF